MKRITKLSHAKIVLPDQVIEGSVYIAGQQIIEIETLKGNNNSHHFSKEDHILEIDLKGCILAPGFIDLHSDALEKVMQPRKNVYFSIEYTISALQAQLIGSGITSIFHGIPFISDDDPRSNTLGKNNVHYIHQWKKKANAYIRHNIHMRFEKSNIEGIPVAQELLDTNMIDMFSIMDHTPQYNKYKTLDDYRYYIQKTYGLTGQEQEAYIQKQIERSNRAEEALDDIQKLIANVKLKKIPLASHDDDSPEQVKISRQLGATICEFPLSISAAEKAMQEKMYVMVGAPNAVRGKSHEQNLSAREAIVTGQANIIASDYAPSAILHAVYACIESGVDLHQAFQYSSLIPAQAVGISDQLGSIEKGKKADLNVIHYLPGQKAECLGTMINGKWLYFNELRFGSLHV